MNTNSKPILRRGDSIPLEYFRQIAEFTYDWESWISNLGEVLWVNNAVQRFTGYTPDECLAMGDYPLQLVAPEHREQISLSVAEGCAGSTANNIEFQALHRDGTRTWVAVSWQPMRDAAGQSLGLRASVRDVAEKIQMREQLRLHNEHLEQLVQERTGQVAKLEKHRLKMEKLAALGELAAGVAHEINNPLAGIRNAVTLFKRHLPSDVKHFDKLELIDAEIERISGITHQMYQLYRPTRQEATQFSIKKTVQEVTTLSLPLARKTNVEIVANYGLLEPTDELAADEVYLREGELKQVLLNLVRNALQASPAGRQVVVTISTQQDSATITVADRGHGIHPLSLHKIFDPFFSTKAEGIGQGMGLGLSVSSSIIEAMKGSIDVASELGKGTLFTVSLPRRLESS